MGISLGNLNVDKIYVGDQQVQSIFYGNTQIYSATSGLNAPTISLNESELVITEVPHAQDYDIYVDGVKKDTVHHERMIGTITNTGTQAISVWLDGRSSSVTV